MLLAVKGVQAESPKDPIYLKTSNGWNAAYAHGNEYAEFRVIGNGAKLQDPYHILLQKGVGMMVSFVDKKELQNDGFVERSRSMGNKITGINMPAELKAITGKI
jgi:hypothetical protein